MIIYIIGMGPGSPDLWTAAARKALKVSTVLIGDKRMLSNVCTTGKKVWYSVKPSEIHRIIDEVREREPAAAILVSGDAGFFSLANHLGPFPGCTVKRCCGISSLVYFAAQLQMPWQDAFVISRHGRNESVIHAVFMHQKVFCLTGGDNPAERLCRELSGAGLGGVRVYVGENLSYPAENITSGTASELASYHFESLAVVMILNAAIRPPDRPVCGLDDALFQRGAVPMTKQEIRAVAIAKLQPRADAVIYDIGAGTGSCSVELALQAPWGRVYSFEVQEDALVLLAKNKERFGTENMIIIAGKAPNTMSGTEKPDFAFIGGTKGNAAAIMDMIYRKNYACRIVLTAIAIETLAAVTAYYADKKEYTLDITQVSVAASRMSGPYHMMTGRNPVFIIRADYISVKKEI
ncbi:precorrin-6Y C5,15-methyltransferase [Megasphaera cerevisiae DSM 20462]|jgi:precorrin-6Y C5,15-methyltransferase (decarboxylating)|uniref:Precorrin-6Y C5,15-methyltransferase n=1 Tax=Megasphaera cerevisiae DSM 20462 TaxID=1122219 RepID=A0A0J6ZSB2_9FIRM|nr:bifunctional cobalt-precorrin-7 (C(5))-methyltransferase/cobalt-precorrin-6B (C(15))-methyltransferase [Megasphaera cerevisiae]KMO87851.1 precorrin-6Y C5,15-methyltransferase [Megasphaera cerevisiae DSM 20462]MCI1750147.1 bifunctional cobalt-precorrin-7 (C(5))-methyltransferase/cobalt-precorrin-6B (C(15))-methyltransferase [Megasphaera cerevisiae]OKY54362.1 precorrin-6Y C5,15-methyltransferase [Megasphaera cerevisiae]SJZ41876.1 precorrin-6Y C5,15-methyltransferase (decarboxylating) [Megaspha